MPYVGGSVASFFGPQAQKATEAVAREMAGKAGDRMHELVAMNTPVRTGNLRTSYYREPTNKSRYAVWPAYRSTVATNVHYAPYVEYGTGIYGPRHAPYEITPKTPGGVLHWRDPKTGKEVFARRVVHPGSRGHYMFKIAAAVVEGEAAGGRIFHRELMVWKQAMAAAAD